MTSPLIENEFHKYINSLTATSDVCGVLGETFTSGTNLFMLFEPENAATAITITSYGGGPPNPDKYRQTSNVQIRMKGSNKQKTREAMQYLINNLSYNEDVCASTSGIVIPLQSTPLTVGYLEGGEYVIMTANFEVRHSKL